MKNKSYGGLLIQSVAPFLLGVATLVVSSSLTTHARTVISATKAATDSAEKPTPPKPLSEATKKLAKKYQDAASDMKLWEDITWLKLGHYKGDIWGNFESEADGSSFFLSKNGKEDPAGELAASVLNIFDDRPAIKKDEQPDWCRFPARRRFLQQRLKIPDAEIPKVKCKDYSEYIERHSAENVSLVFSSYFLGSAASTFGHTFLRIHKNKKQNKNENELLDFGVNYAAATTSDNPLVYAIGGIWGYFKGTFTSVPYYYKVREYNDYESRDLWSYELNFSQSEVDFLMDHLWELGLTYFDYYFFTENCSYHILGALEAVRPEFNFIEELPVWAIPADTVKVVTRNPDLVRNIRYRPSIRTTFHTRVSKLSEADLDLFERLHETKDTEVLLKSDLSDLSKIHILDAAVDYLEVVHPGDHLKPDTESAAWKQKLLIARSKIRVASEELAIPLPQEEQPDLGHDSARFGMGGGFQYSSGASTGFVSTQFRFALHDYLDSTKGYPENSQIEFVNGELRYYPDLSEFQFETFNVIKIASFPRITRFQSPNSLWLLAGSRKFYDTNCRPGTTCFGGHFEGGLGKTIQLLGGLDLFGFVGGKLDFTEDFMGSAVRVGLGPHLGFILNLSDRFKAISHGKYRYMGFSFEPHQYEIENRVRWTFHDSFSVDSAFKIREVNSEWSSNLYYYF